MKYYFDFLKLGVFNLKQAKKIINNDNPCQTLKKYIDSGYVSKVKKDIYLCNNIGLNNYVYDKFYIASHINEDSFVFGHSAFEYYGMYDQIYNNCQVASKRRFKNFEFDYINYECFISSSVKQIDLINGVRVTSVERTIVDSIKMLGKVMDLEELLKCLSLVNKVSEEKIIEMLLEYDSDILYRKTGYILSFFNKDFNLSDSFFDFCLDKSNPQNRGKISNYESGNLEYISKWRLYAYTNPLKLINYGE